MTTMKINVESNSSYSPEELRVFLGRIIESGKEYALNDDSDLADMMTEIEISNPILEEKS